MSTESRFVVSGPLPPSVNEAYANVDPRTRGKKQKGRRLTKTAKAYKDAIIITTKNRIQLQGKPEPPYMVYYHLRFPDYRRRDASNYIKILEDAIFDGLGVDDRHVNGFAVYKYVDKGHPGALVEVRHCTRSLEV